MPQSGLSDIAERWRRDDTTINVHLRFIDQYQCDQSRVVCRDEADKRRHPFLCRVAAVNRIRLLSRAGFSCDFESVHVRHYAGAAFIGYILEYGRQ